MSHVSVTEKSQRAVRFFGSSVVSHLTVCIYQGGPSKHAHLSRFCPLSAQKLTMNSKDPFSWWFEILSRLKCREYVCPELNPLFSTRQTAKPRAAELLTRRAPVRARSHVHPNVRKAMQRQPL